MKEFLVIQLLPLILEGLLSVIVVSYLQKKVHEVFFNYLYKLSLPRETDLYKSGDFFLNLIMILLNCIFVYYYGNGNMDNYGQKKPC